MVPIRPGSKPHAANNSLGPLGHYYMELVSARRGISPLGLESLWGNPEFLKIQKKKKKKKITHQQKTTVQEHA